MGREVTVEGGSRLFWSLHVVRKGTQKLQSYRHGCYVQFGGKYVVSCSCSIKFEFVSKSVFLYVLAIWCEGSNSKEFEFVLCFLRSRILA